MEMDIREIRLTDRVMSRSQLNDTLRKGARAAMRSRKAIAKRQSSWLHARLATMLESIPEHRTLDVGLPVTRSNSAVDLLAMLIKCSSPDARLSRALMPFIPKAIQAVTCEAKDPRAIQVVTNAQVAKQVSTQPGDPPTSVCKFVNLSDVPIDASFPPSNEVEIRRRISRPECSAAFVEKLGAAAQDFALIEYSDEENDGLDTRLDWFVMSFVLFAACSFIISYMCSIF
jgi:hypothetical protein